MGSYVESTAGQNASTWFPDVRFEILWNQGPDAGSGDWCDITQYVVGGNTGTGRGIDGSERFASGAASLTLETMGADGRLFDPENTAGPFYPYLLPMRQIRQTAVWSGTLYEVWRGYVTSWGQTVERDKKFVTAISCRDAFERMAQIVLPSSWYEAVVAADQPTQWWRLDEQTGTVAANSGTPTGVGNLGVQACNAGTFINSPTLDDATLVTYDGGNKGVTFNGTSQYVSVPAITPSFANTNTFTATGWFKTTSTVGSTDMPIFGTSDNFGSDYDIEVKVLATTGVLRVTNYAGATLSSSSRVDDSTEHHFAVVQQYLGAGSWNQYLYVDGSLVASSLASATNWYLPIPTISIGASVDQEILGNEPNTTRYFAGSIAHIAFWNNAALSATQVAAHYNAGTTAFTGEGTGTRIGRVLDFANFPATLRDLDTGSSTVGAYELAGQTLLEYVQSMADTELGQTYMDMYQGGKLNHRSRDAIVTETRSNTSQATWGDEHSGEAIQFVEYVPSRDETLIRNSVTATRSGGLTFTATDSASAELVGERGWSAPVAYDQYDTTVGPRAQWLLARYKTARTRVPQIVFDPTMNPSVLWPQVLGRRIGDRVTVKRTPLGVGSETTLTLVIEGIKHAFTAKAWVTTFTLSAADTLLPGVWDDAVWDTDIWGY